MGRPLLFGQSVHFAPQLLLLLLVVVLGHSLLLPYHQVGRAACALVQRVVLRVCLVGGQPGVCRGRPERAGAQLGADDGRPASARAQLLLLLLLAGLAQLEGQQLLGRGGRQLGHGGGGGHDRLLLGSAGGVWHQQGRRRGAAPSRRH